MKSVGIYIGEDDIYFSNSFIHPRGFDNKYNSKYFEPAFKNRNIYIKTIANQILFLLQPRKHIESPKATHEERINKALRYFLPKDKTFAFCDLIQDIKKHNNQESKHNSLPKKEKKIIVSSWHRTWKELVSYRKDQKIL